MADEGQQRARMTQRQPNQGEWTGPRPSHQPTPGTERRDPESRREGHSHHGNPQVENQDPRHDGLPGSDVGVPFNPLVIKWHIQSQ